MLQEEGSTKYMEAKEGFLDRYMMLEFNFEELIDMLANRALRESLQTGMLPVFWLDLETAGRNGCPYSSTLSLSPSLFPGSLRPTLFAPCSLLSLAFGSGSSPAFLNTFMPFP